MTPIEKQIKIGLWLGAEFVNDAQDDFPDGYYMMPYREDGFDLPYYAKDWEFDFNIDWQMGMYRTNYERNGL